MQYTTAQLQALYTARRAYLSTLASISQQHQGLVLQLQSAPPALGLNCEEVMCSQSAVNACLKQLQQLQAQEHAAYMLFMKQVAFEVIALASQTCTPIKSMLC